MQLKQESGRRNAMGMEYCVGTRPIRWSLRQNRHGRLSGNVVTSHVVKPKEIVLKKTVDKLDVFSFVL